MAEHRWERLPPDGPCASPDGHELIDVMSSQSLVPLRTFCPRCSRDGRIVVLPVEPGERDYEESVEEQTFRVLDAIREVDPEGILKPRVIWRSEEENE